MLERYNKKQLPAAVVTNKLNLLNLIVNISKK